MVLDHSTSGEAPGFLSMMRTLAGLSEAAKLRGDELSAGVLANVAGLLAQVHVDRAPAAAVDQVEVAPSSATLCLA